jgi:hypothetical protein
MNGTDESERAERNADSAIEEMVEATRIVSAYADQVVEIRWLDSDESPRYPASAWRISTNQPKRESVEPQVTRIRRDTIPALQKELLAARVKAANAYANARQAAQEEVEAEHRKKCERLAEQRVAWARNEERELAHDAALRHGAKMAEMHNEMKEQEGVAKALRGLIDLKDREYNRLAEEVRELREKAERADYFEAECISLQGEREEIERILRPMGEREGWIPGLDPAERVATMVGEWIYLTSAISEAHERITPGQPKLDPVSSFQELANLAVLFLESRR